MMRKSRKWLAAGGAVAAVAVGVSVLATQAGSKPAEPAPAKPAADKAALWGETCEPVAGGTPEAKACYIVQNALFKGQVIGQIAAGPLGPEGKPMLVLTVPLGVQVPVGIAYRIGERPEVAVPIAVCLPRGCTASVELTDEAMKAIKAEATLRVGYRFAGAAQPTVVPFQLAGFAEAFGKLPKAAKPGTR